MRPFPRKQLRDVEVIVMAVAAADRHLVAEQSDVGTAIRTGAVWGIIAAAVMAMYAMVAGLTYLNSGFFTPLYHIASSVIEPTAMMTSMQSAMEGQSNFHFAFGPAAVGMMIHFATGAIYGVAFALLARALRLSGGIAVIAGMVYGVIVLLFSSFVGLPVAAAVFDGGDPIADMPKMVGWTTFSIEHVMYGAILGVGWILAKRSAVGQRAEL